MNDQVSLINVTLNREEVEWLLSKVPMSMDQCIAFTNLGLMEFCGNQHNEAWRWRFDELKNVYPATQALYSFYEQGKLSHEKT